MTDDIDLDLQRLLFLMQDIDGFVHVDKDKYDFAMEAALRKGHEEPTLEDEIEGIRNLLDAAMQQGE